LHLKLAPLDGDGPAASIGARRASLFRNIGAPSHAPPSDNCTGDGQFFKEVAFFKRAFQLFWIAGISCRVRR